MKTDIHPKYQRATASCACGHAFEVGSTKEEIKVEICSNCHQDLEIVTKMDVALTRFNENIGPDI